MQKIKIPYQVGQEVLLLGGSKWYINAIRIFSDLINYELYDGGEKYTIVQEWQMQPAKKSRIGYMVEMGE